MGSTNVGHIPVTQKEETNLKLSAEKMQDVSKLLFRERGSTFWLARKRVELLEQWGSFINPPGTPPEVAGLSGSKGNLWLNVLAL